MTDTSPVVDTMLARIIEDPGCVRKEALRALAEEHLNAREALGQLVRLVEDLASCVGPHLGAHANHRASLLARPYFSEASWERVRTRALGDPAFEFEPPV